MEQATSIWELVDFRKALQFSNRLGNLVVLYPLSAEQEEPNEKTQKISRVPTLRYKGENYCSLSAAYF